MPCGMGATMPSNKRQVLPPVPKALIAEEDPDTTVECVFEHPLPHGESFYMDPKHMTIPVFVGRLMVGSGLVFTAAPTQKGFGVTSVFLPKHLDITADIRNPEGVAWYGEVLWDTAGFGPNRQVIWEPGAVRLSRIPAAQHGLSRLYERNGT